MGRAPENTRPFFCDTLGSFPKCLTHQTEHLAGLGMPAEGGLGENQPPVDRDLEAPSVRRDDLHRRKLCLERLQQLGRQTGGPLGVVSDDAVLDAHGGHAMDSIP